MRRRGPRRMSVLLYSRRPAPVIEEMLRMSEESVTDAAGPMPLALAALDQPAPTPAPKPGILARVRGWLTLPKSRAA